MATEIPHFSDMERKSYPGNVRMDGSSLKKSASGGLIVSKILQSRAKWLF